MAENMSRPLLLWRRPVIVPSVALILVAVLALVVVGTGRLATADLVTTIAILIVLAQSWNLLGGYAGLVSLGISAFVGSGAYATVVLLANAGIPWPAAFPLVFVISLVLGGILAIPLMRLRGDYFAIGSLAASLALQAIVQNTPALGASGGMSIPLTMLPDPRTLGMVAVGAAVLATAMVIYISQSRFGLKLMALRDNEPAAQALGVSIRRHHLPIFLLASSLAALAGTVVALRQVSVDPGSVFGLSWTINALLMVVVGGVGTIWGPLFGVGIVYFLLVRQLENFLSLSLLIEGLLLIILIRFAPKGLWPIGVRGATAVWGRLRRTNHDDAAASETEDASALGRKDK